MNKILICCFSLLILCACSWLKTPTAPSVDTPQQFTSIHSNYDNTESNLPYLEWWQQFNDTNLNNLIETALKNNTDLDIALANVEQARGQLKQVELSWIPFFNIFTGFSSNPGLGNPGVFYGIMPQYNLNIVKIIEQQKQAKYNLEITKAVVDGVRLTVISQTSVSYFTLMANLEQLRLLKILDSDLLELIKIRKEEIVIGTKDNLDITALLTSEDQVQGQINIVKHNIILSQNSLHYLLNQNPGQITTNNNFAKLDFDKFKPGSLPATVLQNRPDLLIAEYTVKSAHTGVGIAYSDLFPKVQLDSFLGPDSGNGTFSSPNAYAPYSDAYLNWGISPSTFGQIEAQKGAYQAKVYQYIQTVRKILKDVDNDFSASYHYNQNYNASKKAWTDYAAKYKLQQGLLQTGIISNIELLASKAILDNYALSANQAKLQQAVILVALYQDLAGGYKYNVPHSSK